MKTEAKEKIKEVDKNLGLMRESWLEAEGPKKARWMALINKALDERLKWMKLRNEIV